MEENKKDYRLGLQSFIGLFICILCFYSTPDKDPLLYKFLALFGISPGIPIGKSSVLYIYMLIPIILGIHFIKKVICYWWHYGSRFCAFKFFWRYFPLGMIIVLFLIGFNMNTMYYGYVKNQEGLKGIVYYNVSKDRDEIRTTIQDGIETYTYDLTLQNYSDKPQIFNIGYPSGWALNNEETPIAFIKDSKGNNKSFQLYPNEIRNFNGEYSEKCEYSGGSGVYHLDFIILANDSGQQKLKPISQMLK